MILPPGALAGALVGALSWSVAGALIAASLAAGGVRAFVEAYRRDRLRNWTDAWLAGDTARRPATTLVSSRDRELTSHREREMLARSVRRLAHDSRRNALPGASPANLRAARAQAQLLDLLAERLEDLNRPVPASGVALTLRLLTDPSGPLYDRGHADELGAAIARALLALEEPGS